MRYRIIGKFFLIMLCITLLCGCEANEKVSLYDYKNAKVSQDIYQVSEEDLSFAIKMKLIEKEVVVPKPENANIIEESDVVDLTISVQGADTYEHRIEIGEAIISESFDEKLIGLELNKTYSIHDNSTDYVITVNGIYTYADTITDSIAIHYFNCHNANDAKDDIKTEIEDHRKFEYIYEKLITESTVNFSDTERNNYINKVFSQIERFAKEANTTVSDYLTTYGYSISDYKQALSYFYDEYLILDALSINENISVSKEEFAFYLSELAASYQFTESELLDLYGNEYIYHSIYYDKSYSVLLKYIK